MNKKQIKAILRRLKYYDRRTLMRLDDKINKLEFVEGEALDKEAKRLEKETLIVSLLFNVYIVERVLPKSYDILENPKQRPTKVQAKHSITHTGGKEMIEMGEYNFLPMTEEEYNNYKEILDDWESTN